MIVNGYKDVITLAHPHTILKFELIEKYIAAWAQKLMNNSSCHTLVYIDCMCNSGIYKNDDGDTIKGSAIRVAEILEEVAKTYPDKRVEIYFNDIDNRKIELLKKNLPINSSNFQIIVASIDKKLFLREIGPQFYEKPYTHYFLLYDPYDANIDWEELIPFFRNWGEVLINHMASDPIRAIKCVKKEHKKDKYAQSYMMDDFEKLLPYGSNRKSYEARVHQIVQELGSGRSCYVASFPFFNKNNAFLYDLVHYTTNSVGFELFKKCAWQVFGGRSSGKHNKQKLMQQTSFDFIGDGCAIITADKDEDCYSIVDIAEYLQKEFRGRKQVFLEEVWDLLGKHPIFPSGEFCDEIKDILIDYYDVKKVRIIDKKSGKKKEALDFV